MTQEQVLTDIRWLHSKLSIRDAKYLRNLNRFLSNGNRREGIRNIYTTPPAFYNAQSDDFTGLVPAINVGRSMTMTLLSKLIQTKGRVFFNPTNGLWSTIKTCRNAQIYFDAVYERDNIYQKVQKCVLDALIFEMGVMWIDDEAKTTQHIHPWQFYVDPAEYNYDRISRCMMMQEDFPLNSLKDKLNDTMTAYGLLANEPNVKVTLYRYWDLHEKKKYLIVNSEVIEVVDIDYDVMPFAIFFYNTPVKGLFSVSLIDNVYTHQRQIDDIVRIEHDALTLSPANTIYVPTSANGVEDSIAKMMSNQVGNIVPYNAALGKVEVATPPPIDPAYQAMLIFFINSAFEQEGVSQLSAQSKKPSGINSGVALDTLQDVESERFQTQVDNLIQFYRDINTTMIEVFPEEDDILPKRLNRAVIKWSEIKKQKDAFSMQSSLASVLSKDPKVKMEQIEKLQAQGVINPYMAASLLQLPDLEGAYSAATASYDNSRKIIERALDDDRYDFYSVVNLKQLLDECVNILLQLDAADEDPRILQRLVKLIDIVTEKMNTITNIQNPPPPEAPMPPPPIPPAKDITDIVAMAQRDEITSEAAQALIMATFPTVAPELVNQMLGLPPPAPPMPPEGAPVEAPVAPPVGPAPIM